MSALMVVRPALLDTCLQRSVALHQHLCPRQVLGARMGLLAGELLGLDLPQTDKRLFTFAETDGCFADGVSAATGCWFGRRTLRLVDHGKVAATFVDTITERALRVWPAPAARLRALAYAPGGLARREAQLEGYQVMPAAALLCWEPVRLTGSLAAIIGRPGLRAVCDACGEEIMNAREIQVDGLTLCRGCVGDRYIVPVGTTPSAQC